MKLLIRLCINTVSIWVASYLVAGVTLDTTDWVSVAIVAAVFGVVNALIKPILKFLSFPFIIVTLGLFTLLINAGLLALTASWTSALTISGFWPAVWGAIIISFVSWLLGVFVDDSKKDDD